MAEILMPKATAVWLVENTSLSFEQIADFCGLHLLEVKGIADGEVARDIRGADPLANGQLTREDIDRAEKDPKYRLKAQISRHAELLKPQKKAPRYTPVSDGLSKTIRKSPMRKFPNCSARPNRPSSRSATIPIGIRPISSRLIR